MNQNIFHRMLSTLKGEKAEEKTEVILKELKAFVTGEVIALKDVNDNVFSTGTLGDGLAICPESQVLNAPADGEVVLLTESSRHACGLKLTNHIEILLHIGIDTVNMNGDGFEYMVSKGQKVKAGDPLIRFDRKKIQAAGYSDVAICVVTDPGNAKNIQFITGMHAIEDETVIATFE